jgi:hypothetical protein
MAAPDSDYERHLAEGLIQADDEIGQLRARLAERDDAAEQLAAAQAELAACRAESAQLRVDLAGVMGSASWRVTSPLRAAVARARALRGRA